MEKREKKTMSKEKSESFTIEIVEQPKTRTVSTIPATHGVYWSRSKLYDKKLNIIEEVQKIAKGLTNPNELTKDVSDDVVEAIGYMRLPEVKDALGMNNVRRVLTKALLGCYQYALQKGKLKAKKPT